MRVRVYFFHYERISFLFTELDNATLIKPRVFFLSLILNRFFFTASDRCQQEKRKTINGEDILWAMQSLGFENYAEALKIYLTKYREVFRENRKKKMTVG